MRLVLSCESTHAKNWGSRSSNPEGYGHHLSQNASSLKEARLIRDLRRSLEADNKESDATNLRVRSIFISMIGAAPVITELGRFLYPHLLDGSFDTGFVRVLRWRECGRNDRQRSFMMFFLNAQGEDKRNAVVVFGTRNQNR